MTEKLVRDNIPDLDRRRGSSGRFRTAQTQEMPGLLRRKLAEEVDELLTADPEGLLEEVADVMEVLYAIAELHGHTRKSVDFARSRKAFHKGAFRNCTVMRVD